MSFVWICVRISDACYHLCHLYVFPDIFSCSTEKKLGAPSNTVISSEQYTYTSNHISMTCSVFLCIILVNLSPSLFFLQCPGVFNSPFRTVPHEMELLLRQVKYQAPTRQAPRDKACLLGIPGPTAPSFPGSSGFPWIKSTRSSCSSRPILPPIASKNQQVRWSAGGDQWQQFK